MDRRSEAKPLAKSETHVVGKNVQKVDAVKLATGRGKFVDDRELRGLLHCKLLWSPHAHARIKRIDISKAEKLPGVHCVLTYQNVPRVPYTTAGQGHPEPSPYDNVMFDSKVRYVGDRVAAVAAETPEIAEQALKLIDVEYEVLPAVFDQREAMREGAPVIHDETDTHGMFDRNRNMAAHLEAEMGNVEQGLKDADVVVEREYSVPYVQQTPIEPHICIGYLDEDNRLTLYSSTQVPFHARRIAARVIGIPVKRVRVIKPRIGGGFGAKQEVLIEDVVGMLALRTKRPVRLELTRAEEFVSSRTRHPQFIRMRMGLKRDGTITTVDMHCIGNTGAYGSHALTVHSVTGSKCLSLYRAANRRFQADVCYTNLPVAGAFRGYGAPQGYFALESHVDECAKAIGMDPIELRMKNVVRQGDNLPMTVLLGEGKEGHDHVIDSYGVEECMKRGQNAIGWGKRNGKASGPRRHGIGMALLLHGSGIPGIDMGAAWVKMNEDGSFNLQVGATDLGTGADTVMAQIAAEALAVDAKDIIVYSSDTDFTPFDVGAYASSTVFISGNAVRKACEEVRRQILQVATELLGEPAERCEGGKAFGKSGKHVTYSQICLHSLYAHNQFQIQGVGSHVTHACPPPFETQFAEVEVDTETGEVKVLHFVTAVDCGKAVHPKLAEGQVEGGVTQGLGYALTEQICFDDKGRTVNADFTGYKIFSAADMPKMTTILVETHEPTGPFGAKSIAEIPIDGPAPAVANAVANAIGVRVHHLPITPEKVLQALRTRPSRFDGEYQDSGTPTPTPA
ncbi:MAG: xanthine dehydrogenase family protein molybdopterin-binding subunit [Candidatus Xenobia bacterium]